MVDNARFEDPVAEIVGPSYYPTAVGDLDADGIGDLALGFDQRYGQVYVVYGPTHGSIDASDSTELLTTTADYIGTSVSIGDANGDGIDDLATARSLYERGGRTYLLLGPVTADRSVADADAFFDAPGSGIDLDIVSDFDGDGSGDVVVGAPNAERFAGAVYVGSGGSSGTVALDTSAAYTFVGSDPNTGLGLRDFGIGDATGDGIADLALKAAQFSTVYLVEGGTPAGTYDVASAAWAVLTGVGSELGLGLASGDYDGDGALDIITGDRYVDTADQSYYGPGAAYAFLGPLSGTISAADAVATWTGVETFDYVGEDVAAADVDGDGSLDVLIGAPGADSSAGAVYLQLGFASGWVSVSSLPTFSPYVWDRPSPSWGNAGAHVNTIPDWEGDGGAEVAISSGYGGAVVVYESGALF